MASGAKRVVLIAGGVALGLAGIGAYMWYESSRPRTFELYVFDTPGMPSIFIRTAHDRCILINGGANADIVHRLTELLPFYSRRIDEVVATNDDPKNVTGLIEVLGRYRIDSVTLEVPTSTDPTYAVFLETVKTAKVSKLSTGSRIFELPGMSLDLHDQKKGIFVFRARAETALIVPFNQSALTKKVLSETKPDYLIYSAQIPKAPRLSKKPTPKGASKEKPDMLAGILMDHRFNIRESGVVRLTIENDRIVVRPLRP